MNERQVVWGQNVKEARLRKGLTQEQLGHFVGAAQSSVVRWETGENAPRDDMRVRLAQVLGQDVSTLFPAFIPVSH